MTHTDQNNSMHGRLIVAELAKTFPTYIEAEGKETLPVGLCPEPQ
jgi:hypothetical protein